MLRTETFQESTADYADNTDEKMLHEQLSGEIIGAAMQVLNELKPGLDEKLYERAMLIELKRLDLALLINFKNARLEWNESCARNNLGNLTLLIFMPDSYLWHPCNPWSTT
jgi:hypothetical protein